MKPRQLTILITGAGSGLGRGLSLHFGRLGHRVLATDLQGATALATAEEIKTQGGDALGSGLNVAARGEIEKFIAHLGETHVDVLINNAGLQYVAKLEDFPQERWDTLLDVMLRGPAMLTRAVLPAMRQRGYGRIINIGSIHSLVASAYKSAYVSAKHGLLGFSKVMALETADVDITVNTLCPSYIHTPLVDAQVKGQAQTRGISEDQVIKEVMLKPMPKQCFITVEEVAAAAEFLMQDAARNITGQVIVIDGGWSIQ